jgi:hypothetical protein
MLWPIEDPIPVNHLLILIKIEKFCKGRFNQHVLVCSTAQSIFYVVLAIATYNSVVDVRHIIRAADNLIRLFTLVFQYIVEKVRPFFLLGTPFEIYGFIASES